MINSICVFCGAGEGKRPEYMQAAEAVGGELARRGIGLIYGGGTVGLMGAVARSTLAHGGHVIGVLPRSLQTRELADSAIGDLILVDSMAERKEKMFELSDAFVTLPGGFGTLDELFEALTLIQTGKIYQFPVILFGRHYWAGLVRWITSRLAGEGKISPGDLDLLLLTDDPAEAAQAVIDAHAAQTASGTR